MNQPSQGMRINCPQCGQSVNAVMESLIDGEKNPPAKTRLLSRRTNVVQCPHCGAVFQLSVPMVYHDASKELLITFIPMELNLPKPERERVVGEMTKAVMESLPPEQRRGYLFNPIQPLSLDGMIETILEKDGVTREVLAAQREKLQLVERLLTEPAADLQALATQHDAQIDDEFFQMATLLVENALAGGDENRAQALLQRRDDLLQFSSHGQYLIERAAQQEEVVQEVATWLQKQGKQIAPETLFDFITQNGDSDDHLQAVVGLARPLFDYTFFGFLTEELEKTSNTADRQFLEDLRQRLLDLTARIDQQQQMMVAQVQQLLREIISAPDLDSAIQERLHLLDDLAMSVLTSSIQGAEQRGDLMNAARLKTIYEKIMQQFQAAAPPEMQFINELLTQEDPLEAKLMLSEHAASYGQPLVDALDAIIDTVSQRGASAEVLQQLNTYRDVAAKIVAE